MLIKKIKARHDALANTKLAPEEVAKLLKKGAFLVDVRSRLEAKIGMAPGATNIPLLRIKSHLNELPRDRTLVLYCGTGGRAGKAKEFLEANGFKAVNGGGYKAIRKILEGK
jgi:rhodanese-related sulfurtransferase